MLCSKVSVKNISLDKKPLSKGTPAIDAEATIANVAVIGMYFHSPLILRMSREPDSWSIIPAAINNDALKIA